MTTIHASFARMLLEPKMVDSKPCSTNSEEAEVKAPSFPAPFLTGDAFQLRDLATLPFRQANGIVQKIIAKHRPVLTILMSRLATKYSKRKFSTSA